MNTSAVQAVEIVPVSSRLKPSTGIPAETSGGKALKLIAVRRAVQVLVAAVVCALPWLNAAGWRGMAGSFFALDFLACPLPIPLVRPRLRPWAFCLPGGCAGRGHALHWLRPCCWGGFSARGGVPTVFCPDLLYALRWRRAGARLVVRQAFWGKILLLVLGLVAALGGGVSCSGHCFVAW